MTPSERAVGSAIASLMHVLAREKSAIRARAFDRIRQFAADKRKLLSVIEAASLGEASPSGAAAISKALVGLHRKAAENAAALTVLREGMSDARRRLETLAAQGRKTGLYTPLGGEIEGDHSVTVARSA
ncbi:MAG: hypothetical protein ABL957_15945 [Parvularculaceae bacterium]